MGYFQVKCYKIQTIQNDWFSIPLHWWPVLKSMPPKLQPSWKILQILSALNTLEAGVGPSPQYLNSFVGWKLKSFLKVDHYFLVNAFSRIILWFHRKQVKTQFRKKIRFLQNGCQLNGTLCSRHSWQSKWNSLSIQRSWFPTCLKVP